MKLFENGVHPLIRLVCFIVFAAFVSLGQISSSLLGMLLLVMVWLVSKSLPAPKAWLMVKRLRLFFISIFVMYLWFTPGELIWPLLDEWSPTFEGVAQGATRVFALIILVLGVESLLRLTDRLSLLTGLFYFAAPFKWVGIDRERFIIRVLLTLEMLSIEPPRLKNEKFHNEIKNYHGSFINKKINMIRCYMTLISDKLADKFSLAANQAVDIHEIECEIIALPHWIQWLIPLMIMAAFLSWN